GIQRINIHTRMTLQIGQGDFLALKILHQSAFDIGALGSIKDIKQRTESNLMHSRIARSRKEHQTIQQILKANPCSNPLVKWILEMHHNPGLMVKSSLSF